MVPVEFHAIVLAAGRGSRFPDLTEGRPKALLPVGPLPVIFFPLHMLQRFGFSEVSVVVLEAQKAEIAQRLDRLPQLTLKIDFISIPNESDFGTADTLRHISDKIRADPFIVPCDLVTNADLYPLVNKFREQNATLAALLLAGGQDSDVVLAGPKPKDKPDRDIIMTNLSTGRFVFMASMNDYENDIQLPTHLFRANGKVEVNTKLLDSHIYIMKKWVLDFLAECNFASIKDKLVPYLLKKQMSRPPLVGRDTDKSDFNVNPQVEDIFQFIPTSELEAKIADSTLYSANKCRHDRVSDLIRCFAVKAPPSTFGLRINNLKSFMAVNRKMTTFDWIPDLQLVAPTAKIDSTQVTDCSFGDVTQISAKTSLKNSIFGANSAVSNKVRISDSIVFNGVQIGEGVVLENCVIADKVKIEANCTLKNCVVGAGYVVEAGSDETKVCLSNTDLFMEI